MNMRYLTQFCFVLLLPIIACDQGRMQPYYDHVLFVRQGGGDKVFTINPTESAEVVLISVTRYQFRDVSVQFRCVRDITNRELFDVFNALLRNGFPLTGDFRQSTLPTGTWSFLYMVGGTDQVEITNTELRNRLLPFETIVDSYFTQAQ